MNHCIYIYIFFFFFGGGGGDWGGMYHTLLSSAKHGILTLTSMLLTFSVDLMIGLPTSDGKMWEGKLEPASPHFTN